jgi:Tfp pilus assembly protein PilF
LVLAVLAIVEVTPADAPPAPKPVSLNWPWLAAALVVGGLSWVTQSASQGEDLRALSVKQIQTEPQAAEATAQQAINNDPSSVRLWENLARVQWSQGKDAGAAYQKTIALEPMRALSYFNYARYLQNTDPVKNAAKISDLFNKAIFYSRNDTTLLLASAQWKIKHGDAAGWDELRYILQLQQSPYGKYPAVPEIVNFDYGQAALMLARHALDQGDAHTAKPLLETARQELQKGKNYINSQYQQQILDSVGQTNEGDSELLDRMETDYRELEKRLQLMQRSGSKTR